MGRIGGGELLLILLIALLIFGPSKLSEMGKGLGEGLKNFKKGMSQADDADAKPSAAPAPVAEPPKALGAAPAAPAATQDGAHPAEVGPAEGNGTTGAMGTKTSES